MLEHHPVSKKCLYGAGVFAFVFFAAMSGTAFMINGGFGDGGRSPLANPPAALQALPEPAYQFASSEYAPATTPFYRPSESAGEGEVLEAVHLEPMPMPLENDPPPHSQPQQAPITILNPTAMAAPSAEVVENSVAPKAEFETVQLDEPTVDAERPDAKFDKPAVEPGG